MFPLMNSFGWLKPTTLSEEARDVARGFILLLFAILAFSLVQTRHESLVTFGLGLSATVIVLSVLGLVCR